MKPPISPLLRQVIPFAQPALLLRPLALSVRWLACLLRTHAHRIQTAAPEGLEPPIVTGTGPSAVIAKWKQPAQPNGLIKTFRLFLIRPDGEPLTLLTNGKARGMAIEEPFFTPFTSYQFILEACNVAGCVSSISTTGRTLEAGMLPDRLFILAEVCPGWGLRANSLMC